MQILVDLFNQLPGLVGFIALFTVGINLAKVFGFVSDGDAPFLQAILNFLLLGALLIGKFTGIDVPGFDEKAAYLANLLGYVLQFVIMLLGGKLAHYALKGVPYIGASYSWARQIKDAKDITPRRGMPKAKK